MCHGKLFSELLPVLLVFFFAFKLFFDGIDGSLRVTLFDGSTDGSPWAPRKTFLLVESRGSGITKEKSEAAVDTAEGRCSLGRMLMSLTNATLSGQFSLATDRPDCSRQSDFASLKSVIRGVNRPVCSPMHMHLRCQPPTHTCGVNRPISPSIHPAHPAHPSHPVIQR